MKAAAAFILVWCLSISARAQNPGYKDKLYITAKVWGFVKYFHSEVSVCNVNWDSVLVSKLPAIKLAATSNDFNNVLADMLQAAGPMTLASTPFQDTFTAFMKKNRDFSWFNESLIRSDIRVILDTIRNNFRPHPICWVQDNDWTTSNTSWLLFPYDDPIINDAVFVNYPDEAHRLLAIFKYWNIIRYFNPYNHVLDKNIDSTLYQYAEPFANAATDTTYYLLFERMTKHLDDAHVEYGTWSSAYSFPLWMGPQFVIRYIQNKYVVVKSNVPQVRKGDILVSVDGLTTQQWDDSLRPYIAAGNETIFRNIMTNYITGGNGNSIATVVLKDSMLNQYTLNLPRTQNNYTAVDNYQVNDTLAAAYWETIDCNTGYVNMRNLTQAQVPLMYNDLRTKKAIIFDIRGYPKGTAWGIADLLYPDTLGFADDAYPEVTFPGSYSWYNDNMGVANNPVAYQGQVIILMNEDAVSQSEYSCMMLGRMPGAIKVGSQTAGADGNITYFRLSNDIRTMFTTLGIYYPNGDSTQRIGIVPDVAIQPTIAGIRHGRDEVLEKALEISCILSVYEPNNTGVSFSVYPNPVKDLLKLQGSSIKSNEINFSIIDVTGRVLSRGLVAVTNSQVSYDVDVHELQNGFYLLQVDTGTTMQTIKFMKL
jgi:carboxyl-terminal processing protease